ncbi:hypothetical protein CRUP_022673, partial [Coryphaenoides rupestris]
MGQYSTGKTTFIKYLIEQDFPGSRVGPEPTTDCFTAIMHGETEGIIPGNALTMDPKKPFRNLDPFGNAFLNRFQCAQLPNQGTTSRRCCGGSPSAWTRIILLFDAHKLDFSDELTRAFAAVRGHEDKLRVVLNKADRVDSQQLMRVYGALMWSLGKVFPTPEVLRVYVGSFWSEPRRTCDHYQLLEAEEEDLLADIRNLPRNAAVRKLNDLVKRARLVRAHAHIIGYLKQEMPTIFCKESKKHNLIYQLPVIFTKIQQQHRVPAGDFPDCTKMQERLLGQDFSKFKVFKPSLMASMDKLLSTDIAKLMPLLQKQEPKRKKPPPGVLDGEFLGTFRPEHFQRHPFKERPPGDDEGHEKDAGDAWVVERLKPKYDEIFFSLCPRDGKVSGTKAKEWMVNTHLPSSVLAQVWRLADVDCDGMLDNEEFALAVHLIEGKLEGHWLPRELPPHLVPPSKRPCESEDDEEED